MVCYCDVSDGKGKLSHGRALLEYALVGGEIRRRSGPCWRRQEDGEWWLWAVCRKHGYARVREDDVRVALLAGRRKLPMERARAGGLFAYLLARLTP